MILALNTAQPVHELALLEEGEILVEQRWMDDHAGVETLVPRITAALKDLGMERTEIHEVVVVRGPGPFTSLRAGVAFANALAEGLHAKLYALDLFELLRRRAASADPVLVVLNAGGLDVAVEWKGERKIGPPSALLAEISHDGGVQVVAELKETQMDELRSIAHEKEWKILEGHELQTLGEVLLTDGLVSLDRTEIVEPLYLKGPKITVSKDPWKNPNAR